MMQQQKKQNAELLVAICIPVYKDCIDELEELSLRQCLRVLCNYPVVFVTPQSIKTDVYEKECKKYGVEFNRCAFGDSFFKGIQGYNRLLLSKLFYEAFQQYEYILIYQLDAFVFKDELSQWCSRGYDFVGAPLFGSFSDTEFHPDQARVGNGGFSLRKVKTYLDYFNGRKNVFTIGDIANRIALKKKPYTRWLVWLLMVLGWRNKPRSVANHWKYNEDDFWTGLLDGSEYSLNKPSVHDSLHFAFERFPSEAYSMTQELPFGCHAWEKYQYNTFWKDFIKI